MFAMLCLLPVVYLFLVLLFDILGPVAQCFVGVIFGWCILCLLFYLVCSVLSL